MPYSFKPLKHQSKRRSILAFDVEGVGGDNGFVCGSIVGEYVYGFYTDRERMLNDLIEYARDGVWVFAHNLQYDLPILEGDGFPSGELLFGRYNLLWSKYKRGSRTVRIFDSMNLFPRHSVEVLGEIIGCPKLELDVEILQQLARGRPYQFFSDREQLLIMHYVMRDAEIVYLAVEMLQDLILNLGGELKPTIAGCAMDIFRRTYQKLPWRVVGEKTNAFVRPAFYGGRTENYYYGTVEGVSMYDVTSLYPYAQKITKFPHPAYLRMEIDPRLDDHWLQYEGIAKVKVDVPDCFIPPLPKRVEKKLFFPTGTITAAYTLLELRNALERGVKLLDCDWVIYSRVLFNPFVEFVDALFDYRSQLLSSGSSASNLVKLILNSLYGRWGLLPQGGLYRLINIDHCDDDESLQGYTTHEINGHLYAYGAVEVKEQPSYCNVFFAAQISSQARVLLYDELLKQGEDAVYCDTDSIITKSRIETREGLGGWRQQMSDGTADLLGPKEYALHNHVVGDRWVAKGIPERLAEEFITTGAARFLHAVAIRESIRDHTQPATWVQTIRRRGTVVPKRFPLPQWEVRRPAYWETRPYDSSELIGVCSQLRPLGEWLELIQERVFPRGSSPRQAEFDVTS